MSLEQDTVAQESLKITDSSLDTVKKERVIQEEEEPNNRDEKSNVTADAQPPPELLGRLGSPEMPSIESGAWSDGEAAERVAYFDGSTTIESLQAKKARVENIISTMQHTPPPAAMQAANGKDADSLRRKRKQPQPQREVEPEAKKKPGNGNKKEEKRHLQSLLHHLQQQLDVLQERYQDLYDEEGASSHSDSADSADLDDLNEPVDTSQAIRKSEVLNGGKAVSHHSKVLEKNFGITHDKAKQLRSYLKAKLSEALLNAVDSLVDNIIVNGPQPLRVKKTTTAPSEPPALHSNSKSAASSPAPLVPVPGSVNVHNSTTQSPVGFGTHSPIHSEQTEALSLVVPSRKNPSPVVRHNKSPSSASCHQHSSKHHGLATSVAIPNPSLHHPFARTTFLPAIPNGYDHLDDFRFVSSPLMGFSGMASHMNAMVMNESNHHHTSPRTTPPSIADSYSSFKSDCSDSSPPMAPPDLSEYSGISGTNFTLTLTPTHLRKAKLMFFFCRYPSSAILRQYFPDVKFNRHNTSQMIKWFSNFREFFYIQMEKFSRQALSSGVADPEALEVTRESELFRSLNLHYNKSNEYRAPDSFLTVSTTTLREFFMAVQNGRDSEASWKKSIYKVISKLDEPIPTFFRSTNCLELLQG